MLVRSTSTSIRPRALLQQRTNLQQRSDEAALLTWMQTMRKEARRERRARAHLSCAAPHRLRDFTERCFPEVNPGTEFLPGWHIDLIASELAQLRTRSRQLIINVPPRHLKSLIGSVALPAWLLGHNPSTQIICASYGAELAGKLSRDCRAVMTSPWYRATLSGTRLAAHAVHELTTSASWCTRGHLRRRSLDRARRRPDHHRRPAQARRGLSDTTRIGQRMVRRHARIAG